MKKSIHGLCRTCYKIYRNFATIETKKPNENLWLFECPKCIIKKIAESADCYPQKLLEF